jgi:hypothetical protein
MVFHRRETPQNFLADVPELHSSLQVSVAAVLKFSDEK